MTIDKGNWIDKMNQLINQKGNDIKLSKNKLCQTLSISRSSYYRCYKKRKKNQREHNTLLLDMIEQIIIEMPFYGYRRVTKELHQRDQKVNHKRVLKVMREEKLLCKRKKHFVRTTDSNHNERIYPNLTGNLIVTGINQLWVADITYIRLRHDFVYLAVILDVHSRKCIGWCLDRTLESKLALNALEQALCSRAVNDTLVHHSDRGVQYA